MARKLSLPSSLPYSLLILELLSSGGSFFIPRGNSYSITATSTRDVHLNFVQSRRVLEDEAGNAVSDVRPDYVDGQLQEGQEGDGEEEEEEDEDEEEEEEEEEEQEEAEVN